MAYTEIARLLMEDLQLAHIPLGLAYVKEPPPGIKHYAEALPTACTFWKAAASSLACMGARTFAGIGEEELLQAIPAGALPGLQEQLPKILAANASMKDFYDAKKARFAQV